ncbi:MAG TPA: 23S rRNA (pseudouridine(1915)-N(3))-methyltransferase RlmH [Polyangiaceae bacterium]
MKLTVLTVGKLKDSNARAWADEYLVRIRRWVRCDEVEVRDDAELERRWPSDALVVALEVDGEQLSSTQFSERVERWGSQGKGDMVFVIGGAEGIPKRLSSAAQARLSLSRMTLPHRLAKVFLLEQLYRALSIRRGEPYARE